MELNKEKILKRLRVEKTTAPHELSDSVNYIKKHIGVSEAYNEGYWLKKIHDKGLTYHQVVVLVDKARSLDSRYSKGGFLTNQMK